MYKKCLLGFTAVLSLISCNNDDDGGPTAPEIRDRGEVQLESEVALANYLNTHFYNYEEFANPTEDFNYKIVFDTIAGDNSDKIPLAEQVITKSFTFNETDYELFVLKAREGEGAKPTFADSTLINYKGSVLEGNIFDTAVTPVWLDLGQAIYGFSNALNEFRGATGGMPNSDGTYMFTNDYGIGAVFIPTGLAYFAGSGRNFNAYEDMVFTFELFQIVENTDTDNDGVPSYLEDLNNNGYVQDDFTDSDANPNFVDADDDNDGIPTRDEIVINADGSVSFPDADNDGTPDYLDPDSN